MGRGTHLFIAVALAMSASAVLVATPAEAAPSEEVTLIGTQFVPVAVQVSPGEGIVWHNKELANYPGVNGNHNLIPDSVIGSLSGNKPFPTSSPLLVPGASWSCGRAGTGLRCVGGDRRTVTLTPGRYAYQCGIHPNQMRGLLIVA